MRTRRRITIRRLVVADALAILASTPGITEDDAADAVDATDDERDAMAMVGDSDESTAWFNKCRHRDGDGPCRHLQLSDATADAMMRTGWVPDGMRELRSTRCNWEEGEED